MPPTTTGVHPAPSVSATPRIRATLSTWGDTLIAHRRTLEPILVFLLIRMIGLLVLERAAQLHDRGLGSLLSAWDGRWMLAIAQHGYSNVPSTQTDVNGVHTATTAYAFFPGYPYVVRWISALPGVTVFGAAIAVNVVFGCAAAVAVCRIGTRCAEMMTDRKRIFGGPGPIDADRAGLLLTALFAAAPMAVVFSMAYTEAMFCALAAWALVGVLERRWLLAGFCTLAAGFSRPTAVVLIAVVAFAALAARRDGWRAWAAIVLSPIGYVTYLCIVWAQTGHVDGWSRIQSEGWGTTFDWGRNTWDFLNYSLVNSSEVAPVASSCIVIATAVLALVMWGERVPWPISLYGTGVLASIVLTSGLMMSRPRLLLPAFVIMVPIAIGLARSRLPVQLTVCGALVAFSSWFGAHMLTVFPHAM
ncbi:hypothetical protein [Jongsikchunia kroppenstedtii]|uniref:hypothetical protein n=1 Tax=Jongsikchunia kroppenstedtii TaxID=1121721 RepID=UPI0003640D37|nr:hypothetical protein [Jongsikchunia kroppenstedtii]